jgi:LysR family transcriptional regulator, transcriptional activator of nhaA
VDVARSGKPGFRIGFRVGVVGALPKTVTHRLLLSALELDGVGPVQVRQDNYARLLEELAANRLHLVLSDAPPADRSSMRLHAHLLGETPIFLYGAPRLAGRYKARFPDGLSDAPLLLPSTGSSLRRLIDRWLVERGLRVRIEGEFDDAGLMRVFGGAGRGLFPVRAALRTEVEESYGAVSLGELEGIRERYYAVSVERRVRHRGVAAIIESARSSLARPRRGFR